MDEIELKKSQGNGRTAHIHEQEKKINMVKMSIQTKLVYRFNMQTPSKDILQWARESNAKIWWNHEKFQITKAILAKKDKVSYQDSMALCIDTKQWNRIQSLETKAHIYSQYIFDNRARRKVWLVFTKWLRKSDIYTKKKKKKTISLLLAYKQKSPKNGQIT